MGIGYEKDRVLGDFHEEMVRRLKVGRQRRWRALSGLAVSLAILWYAIQPIGLDAWHQIALFVSVIGLLMVTENPAYQLADEMDLLERKIVKRLREIEERR